MLARSSESYPPTSTGAAGWRPGDSARPGIGRPEPPDIHQFMQRVHLAARFTSDPLHAVVVRDPQVPRLARLRTAKRLRHSVIRHLVSPVPTLPRLRSKDACPNGRSGDTRTACKFANVRLETGAGTCRTPRKRAPEDVRLLRLKR